jgi:hypothetical protein
MWHVFADVKTAEDLQLPTAVWWPPLDGRHLLTARMWRARRASAPVAAPARPEPLDEC